MKTIVIATNNQGKIKEIESLIGKDFDIKTLKDLDIKIDIKEDGKTFEENSLKKARVIVDLTQEITMADDSGLEIDFLNKKPGVNSSRFMGVDTHYNIKNAKILEIMKDVKESERTARFISVITILFPDKTYVMAKGVTEGFISNEARGNLGFGYDPIFCIEKNGKTIAEMSIIEKNKISHRAKALKEIKEKLLKKLELK